jgi:hypothetical protein
MQSTGDPCRVRCVPRVALCGLINDTSAYIHWQHFTAWHETNNHCGISCIFHVSWRQPNATTTCTAHSYCLLSLCVITSVSCTFATCATRHSTKRVTACWHMLLRRRNVPQQAVKTMRKGCGSCTSRKLLYWHTYLCTFVFIRVIVKVW